MDSIKNTTKISKNLYLRYCSFLQTRSLPTLITFSFIFIIFISLICHTADYLIIKCFIIVVIFGAVFWGLFYFFPSHSYKKIKDIVYEYSFSIDSIKIAVNTSDVNTTSQYQYKAIVKAYERKDAFYLCLNKVSGFIVSKDGFTEGGAEELRSLLENKMSKKFKR